MSVWEKVWSEKFYGLKTIGIVFFFLMMNTLQILFLEQNSCDKPESTVVIFITVLGYKLGIKN